MAAIVTNNMRILAAKQFEGSFADPTQHIYLYIGKTLPWDDENSPDTPVDCESDYSLAYREMMGLKNIAANNVSLIIPRNTWTIGTVYTQYDNTIDLFDPNSNLPPFYVVTDSLNVYKCLCNNNGAASTVVPTGTSTSVVTSADGYQWKFMYTIKSADVLSFVTPEWIPVSTLLTNDGTTQWSVQQAAISGTIDRIDMVTAGTQYTQVPTVTITGDGTGATAVATISGGNVTKITVTATGGGYTFANVSITNGGVASNGATAKAIVSPFTGHGADAVAELGGFFVLIDTKLIYSENSTFTVTNDYRRVGLIQNPLLANGGGVATATDYDQAQRLTFTTVSGTLFNSDEIVTGSTSNATGVVMDYDSTGKVLRLVQVSGSFVPGETVVGATASGVLLTYTATLTSATSSTFVLPNGASAVDNQYTGQTVLITSGTGAGQTRNITNYIGISRTATVSPAWGPTPDNTSVVKIASIVPPDIQLFSGNILYMETRRPIARASDQTEDIKIVVEF